MPAPRLMANGEMGSSVPHSWNRPVPGLHGTFVAVDQIPEKSGLPSGSRGAGALRLGLPSAVRGTSAVGYFSHWPSATPGAHVTAKTIIASILPAHVGLRVRSPHPGPINVRPSEVAERN